MRENKLGKIFKIVFVIIIFVLIGFTNGTDRKVTIVESLFSKIVSLPQRGYTYVKNWISNDSTFFEEIDILKEENENLKLENDELKSKLINYEVILSENAILKEHVNLTSSYPDYNVVIGDVISESVSNWEEVFIINRGSSDGIKPGMAVVAEDGLVGYVETVDSSTSKIVSILDPGNTVSARTTRTRDSIVCKGNSSLSNENKLKVIKIPVDLTLVEGDKIETSGLGEKYPKGIPIGEVIEFKTKKNPIENEAVIKSYVNFNKLETVAVIIESYTSAEGQEASV